MRPAVIDRFFLPMGATDAVILVRSEGWMVVYGEGYKAIELGIYTQLYAF